MQKQTLFSKWQHCEIDSTPSDIMDSANTEITNKTNEFTMDCYQEDDLVSLFYILENTNYYEPTQLQFFKVNHIVYHQELMSQNQLCHNI